MGDNKYIMSDKIQTRNDLADRLGIRRCSLTYILYIKGVDSYYDKFQIPKHAGGRREICAPTGELKKIQSKLACFLMSYKNDIKPDKINGLLCKNIISQGFEKGKSFITNADIHKNKKYLISFDVKDFFSQFNFGRVMGYFEKNRYFSCSRSVAVAIAQVSCFEGHLPQGAPTSPVIANLICEILDQRLLKIAQVYRMDYTRYADDLTFSTNDKKIERFKNDFIQKIAKEMLNAGLPINQTKTRIQFYYQQQKVTGLVTNSKPHVEHSYYKLTRAICNHLYSGKETTIDGKKINVNQIEGRLSFQYQISKYNDEFLRCNGQMLGCIHELQKFMFYKYFINNMCPVIITEGKTDIKYIRAAINNLHQQYPSLVIKNKNGKFQYMFDFFSRSEMVQKSFRISADGADALNIILRMFIDQKTGTNYYKQFKSTYNLIPRYPIIVLFDNERTKNHPLSKTINLLGLSKDEAEIIYSEKYFKELIPDSKLFLVTIPNVNNADLCEIENLFDKKTLETIIEGKRFSTNNNYNNSENYGKNTFSNYVTRNYRKINFDGFKVLLDIFSQIFTSK